jgi:hypothetical protein
MDAGQQLLYREWDTLIFVAFGSFPGHSLFSLHCPHTDSSYLFASAACVVLIFARSGRWYRLVSMAEVLELLSFEACEASGRQRRGVCRYCSRSNRE